MSFLRECRGSVDSTVFQKNFSTTGMQVTDALRQFFYAVHPDFFHNSPEKKDTNEKSIQSLQSHIELVQKGTITSPLQVSFYLRKITKQEQDHGERKVRVFLRSNEIHSLLEELLQQCDLSTDHLKPLSDQNSEKIFISNLEEFEYRFFRKKRQQQEQDDLNEPTLSDWLSKNLSQLKLKKSNFVALQATREALIQEIKQQTRLKAIHWHSSWSEVHFHGCVKSIRQLIQSGYLEKEMLDEKVIVFGERTGVYFNGDVVLSANDVPETWIMALNCAEKCRPYVDAIPSLKQRLSVLLGNIKIEESYACSLHYAESYYSAIHTVIKSIKAVLTSNSANQLNVDDMRSLSISLQPSSSCPSIAPNGTLLIPFTSQAPVILSFLKEKKNAALALQQQYKDSTEQIAFLRNELKETLHVDELIQDSNVTRAQMINSCQRLAHTMPLDMSGLALKISNKYSVADDGTLVIPHDWKQ